MQIAIDASSSISFDFFALPATIEIGRSAGYGSDVPDELSDSYRHALTRLAEAAAKRWSDPWDRSMLQSVAAAQAVAKGDIELADAFLNMDDDWIKTIADDDR